MLIITYRPMFLLDLISLLCLVAAIGAAPSSSSSSSDEFLNNLLGPQPGAEIFFRDYWQVKPTVIRRHVPTFYEGIMKQSDIDTILAHGMSLASLANSSSSSSEKQTKDDHKAQASASEAMKMGSDWRIVKRIKSQDGEWWSSSPSPESLLLRGEERDQSYNGFNDVEIAHKAFEKGYSIVINQLEQRWDAAATLAMSFEESLGHRTGINLYFTPPRSQGFEAHFDWMDAFVLQMEGSKQWRLYDALVEQPRPDMKFKPTEAQIEEAFIDFTLEPGDLLYLPSGLIHEASTVTPPPSDGSKEAAAAAATPSLHLTIGVESTLMGSWESLLLDLVARGTGRVSSPEFRLECLLASSSPGEEKMQKKKRSLEDLLTAPIQGLSLRTIEEPEAAVEEGLSLRWGDLVAASIVCLAEKKRELRTSVPSGRLTRRGTGGMKVVEEQLRHKGALLKAEGRRDGGLLRRTLKGLMATNGTLPRELSPIGGPVQQRLLAFFNYHPQQIGKDSCPSSPPSSSASEEAIKAFLGNKEGSIDPFNEILHVLACSLEDRSQARAALKQFAQVSKEDLDERLKMRIASLERVAWKASTIGLPEGGSVGLPEGGSGPEIFAIGGGREGGERSEETTILL